jgi:hypothetical protein
MYHEFPKWLYKNEEGVIVLSKEQECEFDETWLDNPSIEYNTRILTTKGVSQDGSKESKVKSRTKKISTDA